MAEIKGAPVVIGTGADDPNPDDTVPVDRELLDETLNYIRPAVQADGGDIILLGAEDGVVRIEMAGACGGCPLSMMTLKAGIERILKERVPGVREVHAVADAPGALDEAAGPFGAAPL